MDVLRRRHRLSFAAAACLAACHAGFEPARLERLEYGMEHDRIAAELASDEPAVPLVRCFVTDAQGRTPDVVVEFHETLSPHPCYLLISIDGRLAAATTASAFHHSPIIPPESASPRDRTWQPFDRRDSETVVQPWRPAELRALVDAAVAGRIDLAWRTLEPMDCEQSAERPPRGATAFEASLFVLPMLLYLPYWAYLKTLGDEGWDRAESMRERLLTAAPTTTCTEILAAFGAPASDRRVEHPEGVHRVLAWRFGRFSITAGFLDERLLWADFGRWKSWVHDFME